MQQPLVWYYPETMVIKKILMPFVVAVLMLNASAPGLAQRCEITGTVPASIRGVICGVATSVDGGGPPVNQLTLVVTREVAFTISTENPDAQNFMLALLDLWTTDRNVRVARMEVYYGRAHLATAQTRAFRRPTVEFH